MKETDYYLQFEELNSLGIINLFSKKPFNFNYKRIEKEIIQRQYEKLEKELDYKFIKIKKPNQNHTNNVRKLDKTNLDDYFDDVDGLITNLKGVALVTTLADCQGIFLYDDAKKVIGNIHSGWKGTLNRIIENAIKLMMKEYDSSPEDIKVYFCPSILKCCFEVEEDIKNDFVSSFKDINIEKYITKGKIIEGKQKYYIDTIGINLEIIKNMGILDNNIKLSNICTKCNSNVFHSYRAEREIDGRNIGLIAIR